MKYVKLFVVMILMFFLVSGAVGCNNGEDFNMDYTILMYEEGKQNKIKGDRADKYKEEIEESLKQADQRIQQLITEEKILKLKKGGKTVELVYKKAAEMKIGDFGSSIVKRIILPLEGDLAFGLDKEMIMLVTMLEDGGYLIWGCKNKTQEIGEMFEK